MYALENYIKFLAIVFEEVGSKLTYEEQEKLCKRLARAVSSDGDKEGQINAKQ